MLNNLVYTITANTAGAQQAIASLLRSFQSLQSGSASLNNVGAGASSSLAPVLKLTAAIGALVAVAGTAGAALKKGLDANSAAENAQLGIKALVASLYEVRDANGKLLSGSAALDVAGQAANKQLEALRVAGMNTAAEFEDLADAFKTALGSGASAGLGLDDVRKITVDLVQAAGAFNVQKGQLSSEIRAMLTGDEIDNSEIARGLNITGAQIKLWREQGTLVTNLNERLAVFRQLGDEAGKTWTATLSNLNDGITTFLRQSTEGAFDGLKKSLQDALAAAIDPKTGNIQPAFQGIADLAKTVFGDIGASIAGMIDGAVDLAAQFSGWLEQNRVIVEETYGAFKNVFSAVGDVVVAFAEAVGLVAAAHTTTGFWRDTLNGVASLIALAGDGLKIVIGTVGTLGASILAVLVEPLKFVARVIDSLTGSKLASYAETVQRMAIANGRVAAEMARQGVALEGFQKTQKRIADQKQAANAPQASYSNEGRNRPSSSGVIKNKPKKPSEDGAKKAAEQAKRDAAALDTLNKALAEYSEQQAKAMRETALAKLEADLEKREITQLAYLNRKAAIDQEAIAQEEAAKNERIRQLQEVMNAEKTSNDERIKAAAQIVSIRGELEALDGKKAVIAVELDKNTDAVRRYLKELKEDLQANLLELQGDTTGAARARLKTETDRMLADARVKDDADAQALIRQTAEAKERIIGFEDATRSIQRMTAELALSEQRIQRELTAGTIDDVEAQRQVREERLKTAEAMKAQVVEAERLAQLTKDPARIQEAKQLREAYEDLAKTMDSVAVDINNTFFGSIKQGFQDLVSGAKSFGDVMRNIVTSVLSKLAELALNRAITQMMAGTGGSGGGLGGWASAALSFFTGRASGGAVDAGGAYIVGERGPEPFFPGVPGNVVPTSRLQAALAGMLGLTARSAPNTANSRGLAGSMPEMVGGSTNVSVSPRVVVSAQEVFAAVRELPDAEHWVLGIVQRSGRKIQAAW